MATVQFTMQIGGDEYPDVPVEYHFLSNNGRWRIVNVVSADGFNLQQYLRRPRVMEWPVEPGASAKTPGRGPPP